MSIGPTTYFGEERIFVDREACIQAFRNNIQNYGALKYNVLFYYGIAGIGKSKLQEELQKILDEEYPKIFWVSIDLQEKTYRDIGTFLITLRNNIQEKHKVKFHLFNAIHAIYWKKIHPEISLQKQDYPLIKKGDILDKIIDVLESSSTFSLAWDILNSASDSFRKWCSLHHLDISKIEKFKPNKIEELLPEIFAADFFEHFGEKSKFYIFIDTYEALWDGQRDKGSFHEKDEWIRDNLIQNMSGVSWIICGREKLLWTSECDPDWGMYLEHQPVEDLPENYSAVFLKKCGIKEKGIQEVIITASKGVPFYLNLSVDTYEKIIINEKRLPAPEDFGKTQPEIFKTFVKYLYTNEIRALKVLSIPNFWDQELFKVLMNEFDPGLPIGAFSELIKFSFVRKDDNGRYFIHQLMRKSLQEFQNSIDRQKVHKFMLEYYENKLKGIDVKTITPEHEIELAEAFYHAKESLETEDLFYWFIAAAKPFQTAAFWQLIAPIYEELSQIIETKLGSEHRYIAAATNNLALLYHHIGDYEKALILYQKTSETTEKILGSQHPDVAATLDNLASLYESVGDYKKALPLYQKALDIYEKALGPQHPAVAITLNNLAGLYHHMGEYEKALQLYQKTIEIAKRALGPQHPSVANSLNNLAALYESMGYYKKALPLYQKALDIRKNALGSQHPSVANSLNNLAGLYHHMGEYEKALLFYQRALEINEKLHGPQHPDIANLLHNLAALHYQMKDNEKALSLYLKTLDIRERVLGPQHPDVAATLNNLAALYYYMGDYEEAFPLYKRTLEIAEKVLGPQHPIVAATLNNLAELYRQMKDYEKALPLYLRALEISEKTLGQNHPDFAASLNNLALLYDNMGEYEEALPLYKRALEISEKTLGPNHPDVATSLNNLAVFYFKTRDHDKGLPLYKRALEIREKVLGPSHPKTIIVRNNLEQFILNNRKK